MQPAPCDEGQAGVDAVVGPVLRELDHGVVEPVQANLQGGVQETGGGEVELKGGGARGRGGDDRSIEAAEGGGGGEVDLGLDAVAVQGSVLLHLKACKRKKIMW